MEENVGNDNTVEIPHFEKIFSKMFRRDLKRAKVFAIHYLTRRIRLLRHKRGTEQQIEKNTRKAERFQEEIECIKDLDVNIVLKKIQDQVPDISDKTKDGSQDVKERALARLMSSKPIQNRLKDTTDKKDISSQPNTVDVLSNTKTRQTNGKRKWKSKNKINPPSSKKETIASDDDAVIEAFDNSGSSDEEIGVERTATSFFVESMASFSNEKDQKRKRSNNERKTSKETKKASNRLGQRSRQRRWKQRYGYLANHIKSNDDIKKTRKFENVKLDKKETKQAIKAKPKKVAAQSHHPSWEASKRRKLEQNISQTQFQGKKITFED